ncbi:isochorismatase family protein [Peribacillus frigoritolerans]|nr:isochorismatase family protein [Peribacillus frigoritolerans]
MKQTLLIIDAQQELIEIRKNKESLRKKKIVTNINNVIEKAIKEDIPVVFTDTQGY